MRRTENMRRAVAVPVLVLFAAFHVALTACTSSPALQRDVSAGAPREGGAAYYPLAVGNTWEVETVIPEGTEPVRRLTTAITAKRDLGDGRVQYYTGNGTEFMLASRDGLFTPQGVLVLRFPVTLGDTWIAGQWNYDQHRFRVASVSASLTAGSQRYTNCLHIVATSGFHTTVTPGMGISERLATEVAYYYAPQVGPVVTEVRTLKESGEKLLVARTELLRFHTRPLATASPPAGSPTPPLVAPSQAFRFPHKGFFHPMLSPDDRWLLYEKEDTLGKELYVTAPGRTDEHRVPLARPDDRAAIRRFRTGKWSPDGRFFALRVETDTGGRLVLLDFRGDRPSVFESVESVAAGYPDDLFWTSDGFVVYVRSGPRDTIMKKRPGQPPAEGVRVVGADRIRTWQVAPEGTVLYAGSPPHETLVRGSLHHFLAGTPVFPDLRIGDFRLAPDGKHALVYHAPDPAKVDRVAILVRLESREVIRTWPIGSAPSFDARWSPDGTRLAFLRTPPADPDQTTGPSPTPNPHFYAMEFSTGAVQDYGLGVSREFHWTPDSRHILYSNKYAHESLGIFTTGIFLLRMRDGRELGRLTRISAHLTLEMSSSGNFIFWQATNMDTFFVVTNPFRSEMEL